MNVVCESAVSYADTVRNVILAVWLAFLVVLTVADTIRDKRDMPVWKKSLYHLLAIGVKNPGSTVSSALRANGRDMLSIIKAFLLIGVILYALGLAILYFIK